MCSRVMDIFGHFFKIMTEADRTYNKVVKVMADAFQEAKGDPSLWHDPHFATYGSHFPGGILFQKLSVFFKV